MDKRKTKHRVTSPRDTYTAGGINRAVQYDHPFLSHLRRLDATISDESPHQTTAPLPARALGPHTVHIAIRPFSFYRRRREIAAKES
jgi:hypothetical protein